MFIKDGEEEAEAALASQTIMLTRLNIYSSSILKLGSFIRTDQLSFTISKQCLAKCVY